MIAINTALHIAKSGNHVTVLSLFSKKNTILDSFAEKNGINVIYLNKKIGIDLSIIKPIRKVIQFIKPGVIHTHLNVVSYVIFASPLKMVKFHTVHNVATKECHGLERLIMRFAYRFCGFRPVAISPLCATTIESLYHIKASRIPVIFNGVDTRHFKPSYIPHNTIRFINIGRLNPQKNQRLLISAFSIVNRTIPNTSLEIIGEGYLRKDLEKYIKELKLSNVVFLSGETSNIVEKLNSGDVFVISSDYEGLPVSLLEACSCGLPVVSTRAGGVVDVVREGENGYLVPVNDINELAEKMIRLAQKKSLRKAMGEKSRELAKGFDIEECSKRYQKLYYAASRLNQAKKVF